MVDPRWFQILSLVTLLFAGKTLLAFDLSWAQVGVSMTSVLVFQYLGSRLVNLPRVELKSAIISGLSLSLLFRSSSLWLVVLAAGIAILSKFFIRVKGKHVFNPTNIGIAILLALTPAAWVSPGQWGSATVLAFAIVCFGGLTVFRSLRSDVTLTFLAAYSALLFQRAIWLGDPLVIPFHQLESGALLIFAFFMISDPKTTPNARSARCLFAIIVALAAYYFRFKLFDPNGLMYALALCSPLVPILDMIFGGTLFDWNKLRPTVLQPAAEASHA